MASNNREMIIRRLGDHTQELSSLTDGLTGEQLKQRPASGKWSLHELAMHIAEVQDVFVERLARMLVDEKPAIVPFHPDKAREEGSYLEQNAPQRLKDFNAQRKILLGLLRTLTDSQWNLEARHPEILHYSVEKCMESMMRHEEHHLYQMFNIFFDAKD